MSTILTTITTSVKGKEHYLPHIALIHANVFFGVGAVVAALGLPATHPLTFALIREFWAGLILLAMSFYLYQPMTGDSNSNNNNNNKNDKMSPKIQLLTGWRPQWKYFSVLGFLIFGNQGAFIVGIKMAGPVTASVWQPSQPIFTAAISMSVGLEPVLPTRLAGVFVASLGCVAMVLLKRKSPLQQEPQDDNTTIDTNNFLIGNALFFTNCLCTSIYVLLSKRMLKLYPALSVTAWSYNFAAAYMFLAVLLVSTIPNSNAFFCPECPDEDGWLHLPGGAIPALLYFVFFASVGSYGLITWANQHATGTLVLSYNALQPVTSTILTTVLLTMGLVLNCHQTRLQQDQACLEFPTWGAFCGMVGVFGGLYLIVSTEPKKVADSLEDELETVPFAKASDLEG